jgi:hypothetical protein
MAKRRRQGPDKSRAAARARAERRADAWDFPVKLPSAAPEVLEKITPLPPAWCLKNNHQMTHSPAQTWLQVHDDAAVSDDLRDTVARWPFRIARPGKQAGPWVCLALLAHKGGIEITATARSITDLEDKRLVVWSNEHNIYVMGEEVADLRPDDEGSVRNLDEVFRRIADETPQQRAQRRWAQPTVEAREVGE